MTLTLDSRQVDSDGDGKITYDEFVGAMMLSTDEAMDTDIH